MYYSYVGRSGEHMVYFQKGSFYKSRGVYIL